MEFKWRILLSTIIIRQGFKSCKIGGSDAPSGLMLDLGLLKINLRFFFQLKAPAGPYPNSFYNSTGQSLPLLNLT